MKKLVLILVMLFTLLLTGILYGKGQQMIQEGSCVLLIHPDIHHYPETMPNVIFDQVPLF